MNRHFVYCKNDLPADLTDLLETLAGEYPISENCTGINLCFQNINGENTISEVEYTEQKTIIRYNTTAAAARGIGSALSGISAKETTLFKTLGIMLDVSRGMVMKTDSLKRWFRRLALNGYNLVMLYTEDSYKLPGEPFFGRFRGAYSIEELQDLDSCAKKLGIELRTREQSS